MKKILLAVFYSLLLISFGGLFTSCSDKDDPFAGNDNFIVEFTLTQGNVKYKGDISSQTILVKVPEGLSLNGATSQIRLSENASIYPDPASVTEWDSEMIFVVTSYNNKQTKYIYKVDRTPINSEGSILLETQAEVDAFGLQNITSIKGHLIIGRTSGTDSIMNLDPLAKLKEIGYSLTIHPTYSGSAINSFETLEHVGGSIYMKKAPHVEVVSFPRLKTAGSIQLDNTTLVDVSFRELRQVAQSVVINSPLREMAFTNLKYIGEEFRIINRTATIEVISLPLLEKAGGIELTYQFALTKVILPELKEVGKVTFKSLRMLSYLDFSKLVSCTGRIIFPDPSKLIEASFPVLEEAEGLVLAGKDLGVFEFPQLKTLNYLKIRQTMISNLSEGFPKLETVVDELDFESLVNMRHLVFPSTLKKIGKLKLFVNGENITSEVDVRGIDIKELSVERDALKDLKIIGDKVFNGTLSINDNYSANEIISFPKLVGFEEVDSLSLGSSISRITDMQIKGIKKINKGFIMPKNSLSKLEMPDLEEVGGDFILNHLAQLETGIQVFPKLKIIGGAFKVDIGSKNTHTLLLPELISVGKDFILGTGFVSRAGDTDLATIDFPKLQTIGGKLSIKPKTDEDQSNYINKKLTTLNGFKSLKKVSTVSIMNQGALISYEGLEGIVPLLSTQTWSVVNNGYNPTYEDLVAGKLVKP